MNHLENLTKNAELVKELSDPKKRCKKCFLWSRWCEATRGKACVSGENFYFSRVKLWGTKKEFLRIIKKKDTNNLGEPVWNWIENLIEKGNGKLYLKECMSLMREGLKDDNDFAEFKETIQNYGPDNYQLEMDRSLQNDIKFIWWRLIKYQYNLRFSEGGKVGKRDEVKQNETEDPSKQDI